MKIYIVWMGEYDERGIDNVFATRELAESHADALRNHPKMDRREREAVEVEEFKVIGA